MQQILETHQHSVNQKNVRELLRKRHKHKSETKMEMRSYSILKFFEAMKNTGNYPVQQRSSSSSDDECLESTAVKSNNDAGLSVRNVLKNLQNSMIGENKITKYFKDVKYVPNLSNSTLPNGTDKKNFANNGYLEEKTASNRIESLKLNSTTSNLIKQKLEEDSLSDDQSGRTCARHMKDISMAVTIEEKMHIEQTLRNQKTTFEQFTEEVCKQIRNKTLPSETLQDTHEKVCDRQMMELDQNPISRFIESLRQRNTNESTEILYSSPSSKSLSEYSILTSNDTKSHEDIKIFTEQADPRFHFSEPKHMNSIQNYEIFDFESHVDNSKNTLTTNTENKKESIDSTIYSSNLRFCNSEPKLVKNLQTIESFTMDRNGDIHENLSTIENNSKENIDFADYLKKTGNLSQDTDQMYLSREDLSEKNLNNSQFSKMLMTGTKYIEIITNPPGSVSEQKFVNSVWIKQVLKTKSSEIIEGDKDNDFVNENRRNSRPNSEQNDSEQRYQQTSHQMNAENHPDEKYIHSVESYSIHSGKVLGNNAGNINLMQDEEIRSILIENYEKHKRLNGRPGPKNKFQIDSLCTKLNSPGQQERKCHFKRFRKGKMKIYREIFYQLKHLIGDQRITDRAINCISCLLDVGMWALNIVAQKGLVFGNLKILLASGETINCNVPGTHIPQDIGEIIEIHSTAYFILVVEKESIFHKLIEEDLPNRLTRPFVMITGKGFPDLNTQLFLKKLWSVMCVPVFLLVDADPDGINIMLNYRFGSVNNAHVSHHLAVPNAKWLGVFPSEIADANVKRHPLSVREAKMASQLLRTPYMAENPRIAVELNVLIEKNYKAGIEGLIKSDVYLSEVYLPNKFFDKDFI